MLVYYQCRLIEIELFLEDSDTFRFNTTTWKDRISFVNQPDTITVISTTGDINANPLANTGLLDSFKVSYSPADSLKKFTNRDTGIFTNCKEGNQQENLRRKALTTSRTQNAAEVVTPYYFPLPHDNFKLFKEKQEFMNAVFDKTFYIGRGNKCVREKEGDYNSQSVQQKAELIMH